MTQQQFDEVLRRLSEYIGTASKYPYMTDATIHQVHGYFSALVDLSNGVADDQLLNAAKQRAHNTLAILQDMNS